MKYRDLIQTSGVPDYRTHPVEFMTLMTVFFVLWLPISCWLLWCFFVWCVLGEKYMVQKGAEWEMAKDGRVSFADMVAINKLEREDRRRAKRQRDDARDRERGRVLGGRLPCEHGPGASGACRCGVQRRHQNRKPYEPETCEDFAKGPTHGIGLKVRRKRMGSTWDITKHYLAEFGRFGGMVTVPDADGAIRERWIVFIQDLLGGVYGFAEYTSAEELHKVWELD